MALSAVDGGASRRSAAAGRRLCLAGAALGALGLLGWITGATRLTAVLPGQPPMMPNTALALLLIGAAGALRRSRQAGRGRRALSMLAAGVVLTISVGTLAEYLLTVDLHIDQRLLFSDAGPYPGRPSPPTAMALTLLGAALFFFDARPSARVRPSEWLALSAGLIALTAAVGQVFGAGPLYRLEHAPVIGVAVPTAVSLLLTSLGLLFERPDSGVMRVATSRGPGGVLLRRLAAAAIIGPVLLGVILTQVLAVLGIQEFALVYATLAVAATVVGLCLLTFTAVPLNRMHELLESSRARTQALIDQAADGIFVADADGRYTDINDAGCRMLGYTRDELVGKTIADLVDPEYVERLSHHKERLSAGDTDVGEWMLRRKDGIYLPVEVSARILPDRRWQAFVRDISERKRAQDEIRQSMERFDLALRGADLGAYDWNVTTGEVVFNARWAEMRGARLAEIRPHVDTWLAGVHPDDLPRVQRVLADYFQGLTPEYETEHRVATRAGDWIWILDRGRIFARDAHGRPTRMVGTELDVTGRKRAEEALRLSESKFSGIVSISADAIISIDEGQRITLFNEGAEHIFGYARSEALGAPLDILIPERLRAAHRRHVDAFAAGTDISRRAGARGRAIIGLRKDGEEFLAEASISRLDVDGRRLLTVVLRDVTEQRRRESEQEFLAEVGAVLATSLDYQHTLTSIAELAVRRFSDACIVDVVGERGEVQRLKVVTSDPARAQAWDVLAHFPLDRERPHLTRSARETGRPVLMARLSPEMVASMAQSEEHLRALRDVDPRSLMAVPLIAHDKLLGVIAFISSTPSRVFRPRDLHLAEELAQRAALSLDNARLYHAVQLAVQARDDVLGIVAHDLRNPLGVILMQAAMLGRQPERGSRSAEAIARAANRMNRLIQDLLDVTCLEAGQLSVARTCVSVTQLLADSVEAQGALASSASLELRVELPTELLDVSADRDRLLQVFENLIGNAIKFTGAGGRVTVGASPREREVLLWVADTGPGIPAEDAPRLFDRFWQARRPGRSGAGLGLPIVKGIVEAHGGRIWVESAPGRGSTFFFTIPTTACENTGP